MNKKPTLTLGTFKKDNKEIQLSKDTEDKLAKLATAPVQTTQKQDVSTTQDKAKSDNNNKSTEAPRKTKEIEAQKPNQPQTKKAGFNKEDHYAVMNYLQKNYPKCFPDKPPLLPLAIGIHNQLLAVEDMPFSKTKVRSFFANYTRTKKYLTILVVGNDRVDLNGAATSKVTEDETKNIKNESN